MFIVRQKSLWLFLLLGSSFFGKPVKAQTNDLTQKTLEITPELGTVPGIYYDPSGELSPSISDMEGAAEGGVISFDVQDLDNRYNVQRIWKKGAKAEQIIKVGDWQNNLTLNKLIDLDSLTLREIAANGGAAIESIPLKSVGLIRNMTLSEFFQVFPELERKSLEDVPLLQTILGREPSLESLILNSAQENLIKELAVSPVFENVPVSELIVGDWSGILDRTAQKELQDLVGNYPELNNLPADKLFPVFSELIVVDWNSIIQKASAVALEQGQEMLTEELLEAVPELANIPLGALPIDDLLIGDIEGLADKALGLIPDLADKYLSDLANFSQIPGNLLGDAGMILLTGDLFGRLDIAYAGETETPITRVLTGGTRNQEFKPEPCFETSCKHFELVDVLSGVGEVGDIQGKAWIQGSSQSVPGGKGFLRFINGGKERTGVSVWGTGSHVKLSLENIDEGGNGEPATAQIWLDFQFCIPVPFLGEQCTPHSFSLPTPWKVREGGLVVVFSRASAPEIIDKMGDLAREGNIGSSPDSPQLPCVATNSNSCGQPGDGVTTGTFTHPIALGTRVSSPYGWRRRPMTNQVKFHHGIDYAAPIGTPVKSVDGGTVIKVSSNSCPDWGKSQAKKNCGEQLGNWIDVRHADGKVVRYGHLQQGSVKVREGMTVSKGQVIAGVGSSGWSTGPHLDLRVHDGNGNYENPDRYIKR